MKTPTLFDSLTNEEWIAVINDEIAHEDSVNWLFDVLADDSQLVFELFDDPDDRYFGCIEDDHEWIAKGGNGGFF